MKSCCYLPYQDPLEHGHEAWTERAQTRPRAPHWPPRRPFRLSGWSPQEDGRPHPQRSGAASTSLRRFQSLHPLPRDGANAPEHACHFQVHDHRATGTDTLTRWEERGQKICKRSGKGPPQAQVRAWTGPWWAYQRRQLGEGCVVVEGKKRAAGAKPPAHRDNRCLRLNYRNPRSTIPDATIPSSRPHPLPSPKCSTALALSRTLHPPDNPNRHRPWLPRGHI